MASMNVSLPDPLKTWVEAQLADGRFANTSDYIRHLIRRDQDRAHAIAAFQQAVSEGLDSGPPRPFDLRTFTARMHAHDKNEQG